MKEISDLPPEILLKCFQPLAPPDLKRSVLVSEEWRAVGEDPSLWTWCTVTIRNREDLDKLSVRRLRNIKRIRIESGDDESEDGYRFASKESEDGDGGGFKLLSEDDELENRDWGVGDWEALLHNVTAKKYPKLEEIYGVKLLFFVRDVWGLSSTNIEPEVIASALVQLENVDLSFDLSTDLNTDLSTEQITSILICISTENNKLKKLNLKGNDLFDVEPEALARGLIKLEDVDLSRTYLSTEQITSILTCIFIEDNKLKNLKLHHNDPSGVEPEALARGLIHLEEVDLRFTELSTEQITSILTNMARKEAKLKMLSLCGNNLSGVEPEVLARGMIQIEEVHLGNTQLGTEQITNILTNFAGEEANLKKLNLYGNNLSDFEPEALARGLIKLEDVDLSCTGLSTYQITRILTCISIEDNKLKKLNLGVNDMSDVEPEALARGVIKLEDVDLSMTGLRTEQITSILTNLAEEEAQLKKLNLCWNKLSGVEPKALARVVVQLEDVNLSKTKLTTEQITSILINVAGEEAKLKKLDMLENNTFNVKPEDFHRAQNILRELKY